MTELKQIEYIISVKEYFKIYRLIRIFGSKNLDAINFLNKNKEVEGNYLGMSTNENEFSDDRTVEYIKSYIKRNKQVEYVQLIKK